jgi:hypothetical protein
MDAEPTFRFPCSISKLWRYNIARFKKGVRDAWYNVSLEQKSHGSIADEFRRVFRTRPLGDGSSIFYIYDRFGFRRSNRHPRSRNF